VTIVVRIVVGVVAALLLTGCAVGEPSEPESFSGYTRSPVRNVAAVSVPAVGGPGGDSFSAAPGGLRLVYFGFTYCPDVCPTTLSDIRRALAELEPADRARVALDVVTIDPERDQPQVLADYVTSFVPEATSRRTQDPALLRSAADAFGADYSVRPGPDGDPEVSHSADVFVVDDAGTVVLAWPFGTAAPEIASDLERLLAGERPVESPGTVEPAEQSEEQTGEQGSYRPGS